MQTSRFIKIIWDYYKKNRRDFSWRNIITPYRIVVSEIMLQQTQAPRVVPKFESFIKQFPDFQSLAKASLQDVLKEWKGLGYNRRGMNLKRLAETIISKHNGILPNTQEELLELPGIGRGTAGSLLAFAYNIPIPFIETNIRTVFIHFFFKDKENISDKEIFPLIEKTLDHKNPREWYYALMDYGVMLKKTHKNPSQKSAHYKKQSAFNGSTRQLRSSILQFIIESKKVTITDLQKHITHPLSAKDPAIIQKITNDLLKEGFIVFKNKHFSIQ